MFLHPSIRVTFPASSLALDASSHQTYPWPAMPAGTVPAGASYSSLPTYSALAPYTLSSNAAAMRVNFITQSLHLARMTRSPCRSTMLRCMSAMNAMSPVRSAFAAEESLRLLEVEDEAPTTGPDWLTSPAWVGNCCWK